MTKNIKNSDREIGMVEKLDDIDIVLKFKLRKIFKREIFLN